MVEKMKIAVLMSTYNGEKYLEEQIESILNQVNCDISIYIRDDGSTENTRQILKNYETNNKINIIYGENIGVKNSFFELLYSVKGYDFYSFADQDDIWDLDKISVAVSNLKDIKEPACYYCNSRLVDENNVDLGVLTYTESVGKIWDNSDLLTNLCVNNAMGCTMVINNHLHEILVSGRYPEKCTMHDTYIKTLCAVFSGKVIYDDLPHMRYRQHSNNTVGVKLGIKEKIVQRLKYFLDKKNESIADNANEILMIYKDTIPKQNYKIVHRVSEYRSNLSSRISLALFSRFENLNFKRTLILRLALFFGNR